MLKINHITREDGAIEAIGVAAGCSVACIGGEFFALEHGEILDAPNDQQPVDVPPES